MNKSYLFSGEYRKHENNALGRAYAYMRSEHFYGCFYHYERLPVESIRKSIEDLFYQEGGTSRQVITLPDKSTIKLTLQTEFENARMSLLVEILTPDEEDYDYEGALSMPDMLDDPDTKKINIDDFWDTFDAKYLSPDK